MLSVTPVANLRELIELVRDGDSLVSGPAEVNFNGAVFGAQILARTITAAQIRAPEGRSVASLGMTFSRPRPVPIERATSVRTARFSR